MLSGVDISGPMGAARNIHPDSKVALAQRLKLLREVKHYNQTFAAKVIGESQATWGFWESANNLREPTARQLLEIEIKFGYPREWVQSGIGTRVLPFQEQALLEAAERLEAKKLRRKQKN
jgi:transcriptional regulator with XRE-family HTH domain